MSRATGLFFYRRLSSPLHATRAGVGALWALALTAAALLLYHPLVLLALLAAVLGAAAGAGVGHELRRALRTAAIVAVPIVLVNVLASRQGLTVFARLGDLGPFGQGDLTVEAVVYGAVIALKVTIVILIATLASLAVDPDELLRIFRRLSFRSALTASLAIRMIPLLAADSQRLAEAQRTRPQGALHGARGRLGAARGDARRLARPGHGRRGDARGSRLRDRAPRAPRAASVVAARHRLRGLGRGDPRAWRSSAGSPARASFEAYPSVHMPLSAGTLALGVGLVLAALLPFADRRGIDP